MASILYLLLPILNCRGRFLLSVSFWKRDIIKYKFLGLLFIGSLIKTFLWKCHPFMYRVWFLLNILLLLLHNLILFHDWLPTVTSSTKWILVNQINFEIINFYSIGFITMWHFCVYWLCCNSKFFWVIYLWTNMILLGNIFEVQKSLSIMLMDNEIRNTFF